MSSASIATEVIPDEDYISRLLDWPSMYEEGGKGLLAANLFFTFPDGQPESVVWRKYAPAEADVHAIGCQREAVKRVSKPHARYTGCRTAHVGTVRAYRTARGHGFSVAHEPSEGIHHAEVAYRAANEATATSLKKADKGELRLALCTLLFQAEALHSCPNVPAVPMSDI
jgi:hypothetical protein